MFTRAQYMAGECTHAEYYAQFVNGYIKQHVKARFGKNQLIAAYERDTFFNTIPIQRWDSFVRATDHIFNGVVSITEYGDYWTLSTMVCTAKEAARQIVEEAQNDHV